jgi:hypothetical protein
LTEGAGELRADLVPAFWHSRALELFERLKAPSAAWAKDSRELLGPFIGPNTSALSRGRLLARLPKGWRNLPAFGRLSLKIERLPGTIPHPLRVWEVRAFPHLVRASEWAGVDERSVAVAIRWVEVAVAQGRPVVSEETTIAAAVSVHAIGRRFERGTGGSDSAVLRDLLPLTDKRAWRRRDRRERNTELDVLVDSGFWRGTAGRLDGQPVLLVRTFVEA